jgi:hypothetical protein
VARAGFFNAVFTEVDLRGKDWSHTDFGASVFWNCSFKGTLNDIIFRGKYLLAYQYELSGEPKRTGLHMVDFSDSELHWVAAYNCCTLEKVNLPDDGSAFICNTHDLLLFSTKKDINSIESDLLQRYFQIIRPDASNQTEQIVSKNDRAKVGGPEVGNMLYETLRQTLA